VPNAIGIATAFPILDALATFLRVWVALSNGGIVFPVCLSVIPTSCLCILNQNHPY
jgi:hypothetical protein